jgi:hypothetical protein
MDGTSKGFPDIEVSPSQLDFGDLASGGAENLSFSVRNNGDVDSLLEIQSVAVEGDGEFTVLDAPADPLQLPEGAEHVFDVVFVPTFATEQHAVAVVMSDDSDEGRVPVDLTGALSSPDLAIEPDPLDLGEDWTDCDRGGVLTLTNVSDQDVTLDRMLEDGGGFSLLSGPVLPLVLPPGAAATVQVGFDTDAAGNFAGTFTVEGDTSGTTRRARQLARARRPIPREDVFELPEDPPVDILFVIENDTSTEDDLAGLASNFEWLTAGLADVTNDWQMMVVVGDDACNGSGILTPETPDYADRFATAAAQRGGLYTESLLYLASAALERTAPLDCNAGFLRDDSLLHVIAVSDEFEQSPLPWDVYVARMAAFRHDPDHFRISAVAGDIPSGCRSATNQAGPGKGYYEATQATGGRFVSICSDWASSFDALARASKSRPDFTLSGTPAAGTIAVRVDGQVVCGWTYDAPGNAIVFAEGDEPAHGSEVQVSYQEPVTCRR